MFYAHSCHKLINYCSDIIYIIKDRFILWKDRDGEKDEQRKRESVKIKRECVMTFKSSKDSESHSGLTGIEAVLVECCIVLCPFFLL